MKQEIGTPKVTAPSSSATPFKTEFRRSGLAVNRSRRGLRIINVRGSFQEQDDNEECFASPPISPQPIPIPIYFEDDDDDEGMLVKPKLERTAAAPLPVKHELEEKYNEDPLSSDILVEIHEHDRRKRSKFFYCTCGIKYASKKNLRAHIKQKTEKWNFQCNICNKFFFYNSTLKNHMFNYHQVLASGSKDGNGNIGSKVETFADLPMYLQPKQ